MLIDVHNHVMPAEALGLLRRDPRYGVTIEGDRWAGGHHVPFTITASFHDPAAKLAEMDANGIGSAVVSCPPPLFCYHVSSDRGAVFCEAANDGMARFCAAGPGRLRWLANLPMQDPARAAECYREAAGRGAAGAAVGTSIAGRRLDEPAFEEFWATAAAIGRPVLIHPAFNEPHPGLEPYYLQNVVGNPLETTLTLERLICAGVLTRHPELRVVALHGGGYLPYQAGRLAHACGVRSEIPVTADDVWRAFGQLYFDTITHDVTALRYLAQRAGAGHVLLGTDLPFDMAMQAPAAVLAEAFAEPARHRIGAANAASLFGLDGMLGAGDGTHDAAG
ncbi:MAG: amidohydrolase family protein, partial [Actinobacteria bacterium]|nr:amidohydrolase family protein [Actinomycetota bacterium]MBO0818158.1 amidohydrolase family protein [Actinomycetota bacterium]